VKQRTYSGFTLIELIVVMGIIAILAAIVIIAVNPARQLAQARNSDRQSDVTNIQKALNQYRVANAGSVPAGITAAPVGICDGPTGCASGTVDLSSLTPTYLTDLPKDPSVGSDADTGYTVSISAQGRITVAASNAELAKSITTDQAAFTPKQIPNLTHWYDATLITGVPNGTAIGATWADNSGTDNDATQATAANQPRYQTNIINGKPVVRFDGTDDYLGALNDTPMGERTYVFVARTPASATSRNAIFGHGSNVTGAFYLNYGLNNRPQLYLLASTNYRSWNTNPLVSDGNAHLFEVYVKGAAAADIASAEFYIDGTLYTPLTTGQTGTPNVWADLQIGRAYAAAGYYYTGDLAELAVYRRRLTEQQRANLVEYSQQKWATP
jgi:type IV pilus assembly protein PilA